MGVDLSELVLLPEGSSGALNPPDSLIGLGFRISLFDDC